MINSVIIFQLGQNVLWCHSCFQRYFLKEIRHYLLLEVTTILNLGKGDIKNKDFSKVVKMFLG